MKTIELSKEEKRLLLRVLDYFRTAEEREIAELSLPSGNKAYIPECEERLRVFESLINKFKDPN